MSKKQFTIKKVLGPRAIIRIKDEAEDQTDSGVFLAADAKKDYCPYDIGEVIKIGDGGIIDGIHTPCPFAVGDKVLINVVATKIQVGIYTDEDGNEYTDFMVIDGEVSAILDD